MTLRQFAAALLGCIVLALPAAAQTAISVGIDSSFDKHEMQGGAGLPHFSLISESRDLSLEIIHADAFHLGSRPVSAGFGLIVTGSQAADAADSPQAWVRRSGQSVQARTTRLLVTLRTPLFDNGSTRIDAGLGIGLAQSSVHLQRGAAQSAATGTVPHATLSLRLSRVIDASGAAFWIETRYHASPPVHVVFDDGTIIGHEISGFGLGVGITIPLGK
jgi:hypothetical protein